MLHKFYVNKAVSSGHFSAEIGEKLHVLFQRFLHSKTQFESDQLKDAIKVIVSNAFAALPTHTINKHAKWNANSEEAHTRFNASVSHYILERPKHVCLFGWLNVGINCSKRRGPIIECFNQSQQYELGDNANSSFALTCNMVRKQ